MALTAGVESPLIRLGDVYVSEMVCEIIQKIGKQEIEAVSSKYLCILSLRQPIKKCGRRSWNNLAFQLDIGKSVII